MTLYRKDRVKEKGDESLSAPRLDPLSAFLLFPFPGHPSGSVWSTTGQGWPQHGDGRRESSGLGGARWKKNQHPVWDAALNKQSEPSAALHPVCPVKVLEEQGGGKAGVTRGKLRPHLGACSEGAGNDRAKLLLGAWRRSEATGSLTQLYLPSLACADMWSCWEALPII